MTLSVLDSFIPSAHSIEISTTITPRDGTDSDTPFSVALGTGVAWSTMGTDHSNTGSGGGGGGASATVWLPWGKGCVSNPVPSCFAAPRDAGDTRFLNKTWANALNAEPLSSALYRYGATSAGTTDTFALPLVSVLSPGANSHNGTAMSASNAATGAGFSLVLSPEDSILELNLRTTKTSIEFARELLRLGVGKTPVRFSAHLVGHAACWRPGLSFLTTRFAPYFVSQRKFLSSV